MHPFEEKLEEKLIKTLGNDDGKSFMGRYTSAKDKSFDDIISQISGTEPDLTKHDTSHIKNVLTRVHELLGDDVVDLDAYEMYTLAIIVLFHDVGNIFGRKGHQTMGKVAKVYNYVRGGNDPKWNQERLVVLQAVNAHTGKTETGEVKDTLKEVEDVSNLENGKKIRLRELAAILRFADELEEGPNRTSMFKQTIAGEKGGYSLESMPFHNYSNVTNVFIDRGNSRVVLRYHIDWDSNKDPNGESFKNFLKFCFTRILKLDDERKYARYYSQVLSPFKKTEVSFHFSIDNVPVELPLESLEFYDKIPIPRLNFDHEIEKREILTSNPEYDVEKIFGTLSSQRIS
jgi:hypothetical protein